MSKPFNYLSFRSHSSLRLLSGAALPLLMCQGVLAADSDADGYPDALETYLSSNPNDAASQPSSIYENVELYLSMDAATQTGSVLADHADGHDHDLLDNATVSAGLFTESLVLDGSGDRVNGGNILNTGTGSYSVSLWFKANTVGGIQFLASKGNKSSSQDGWSIWLNDDHIRLRGNHGVDGTSRLTVDKAGVVAGQWYYVVLVIDQTTGKWIGYLDGVSSEDAGSGWTVDAGRSNTFSPGVNFDNSHDLTFGANAEGASVFNGSIDDAVIARKALEQDQIGYIYTAGLHGYAFGEVADSDEDGMPDIWETAHWGNLTQTASLDADSDGLSNVSEFYYHTQPQDNDSDDDTFLDGFEIAAGADPIDGVSLPHDVYADVATYHPLDIEEAGISMDVFGAHNASLLGTNVSLQPGLLGNAISTPSSGGDERLDFGNVLDTGTASYTASLWFKADTLDASVQSIVGKGNNGSKNDGWRIWLNYDGLIIRGNHGVDGTQRLQLRHDGIKVGQWYHVAMVINQETGKWEASLNGVHSSDSNSPWYIPSGLTDSFTPGVNFDNTSDLKLALRQDNGYEFRGLLDDFSILRRALTAEELNTLHSAGRLGVAFGEQHDSDADGLPDLYENLYLGGDADPAADADDDGLTNAEEYALGSRPDLVDTDGDTISDLLESQYGTAAWDATNRPNMGQLAGMAGYLTREKWAGISGATVAALTSSPNFLQAADEISLVDGTEPPRNEGDNFGARIRGALTAATTGYHSFWIAGDNNFELWLSSTASKFSKKRIAYLHGPEWREHNSTLFRDWDRYGTQRSKRIWLEAGQAYFFEVLHKERTGGDFVSVAWQQPGGSRELIPASVLSSYTPDTDDVDEDYLPDSWEAAHGLSASDNGATDPREGEFGDYDADGLTNREEYLLGTDPTSADSDNDGVNDYDEVRHYGSNPTLADMAAATSYASAEPQIYQAAGGRWQPNADGSLYALECRGGIDYSINLPEAGIYIVQLTGRAKGEELGDENMPLDFYVDGAFLGRRVLASPAGAQDSLEILTCHLEAGDHTFRLVNENVRAYRTLQIDAFEILKPGGVDANANGQADWLDAKLAEGNHVAVCPSESLTSPAFVEGTTWHFETLSIENEGEVAEQGEQADGMEEALQGLDYGWYADIDLPVTGSATIDFIFENGAISEQKNVSWISTNTLEHTSLTIRKGDSLKLDAWPLSGSTDGGAVTYQLNDQALPAAYSGTPVVQLFDAAGTYSLVATHTAPDANVTTNTLSIEVVGADFGDPVSALSLFSYDWEVSGVGENVYIEPDSRILFGENDPLTAGGRSFRVTPLAADTRYLLARLEEGGPVVARGTIEGFYVAGGLETSANTIMHTYEDGTRLIRGSVVATSLPPGGYVRIQINTSGVTAVDGSNYIYLYAEDFDEFGRAFALFEITPGTELKNCHFVQIFDADGNLMN